MFFFFHLNLLIYFVLYLAQQQLEGELNKLLAIEAPLYQLYHVNILNKVRTKTEIHLGKLKSQLKVFIFFGYLVKNLIEKF